MLQPMKIALIPKTPPTAISIPAVARINEMPRLIRSSSTLFCKTVVRFAAVRK